MLLNTAHFSNSSSSTTNIRNGSIPSLIDIIGQAESHSLPALATSTLLRVARPQVFDRNIRQLDVSDRACARQRQTAGRLNGSIRQSGCKQQGKRIDRVARKPPEVYRTAGHTAAVYFSRPPPRCPAGDFGGASSVPRPELRGDVDWSASDKSSLVDIVTDSRPETGEGASKRF